MFTKDLILVILGSMKFVRSRLCLSTSLGRVEGIFLTE